MMPMFNPPHPGEVLRALYLEPLGLTVTRAAEALGVSRKSLSAILKGKAGISPEMAICLSMAFDTSAESWLNQQAQYDLWLARQNQLEELVEDANLGELIAAVENDEKMEPEAAQEIYQVYLKELMA